MSLRDYLGRSPYVAILRGVTPAEAADIGRALRDAGITVAEIPLNVPDALESIRALAAAVGDTMLVGAGTVLGERDVDFVVRAGGRLIVSPNMNAQIVKKARAAGAFALPGALTPTECMQAVDAGADGIKLFPSQMIPPAALAQMRLVLPSSIPLVPTGGITAKLVKTYLSAGANGFGIGSAFYRPGLTAAEVATNVRRFVTLANAA